ncbi:TolC family protein [Segetibacter sp. 3557_3]|uniref:TolC family protein n=1 Tax=Segetibacter sp. 3557_3 TaxID=2547429 RepID=UPI001058A6D9|nr:TolC family protein [Segetibacter sp. 3557_3]TDH24207.1 TolC family protein [Segetibacter sp. 3557_3]
MHLLFRIAVLLLITAPPCVYAQDSTVHRITLKQSVEKALANNLQVQQSKLQNETTAIQLRQAKANAFPDLFGNLGHGLNQGRSIDPFTNTYINQQVSYASYNLNSSVILFNGFQLKNAVRQSTFNNQAAQMDVQQTKDNIMLNVILAYVQMLNGAEQLIQARNQEAVTRKQMERLETLNKAGAITPVLLYDLKGQLANDELAIVSSANELNAARLSLCQQMNVPYDKDLQVEPFTTINEELVYDNDVPSRVYEVAEEQLAIIKAAEYRKQSALANIKIAKGTFLPTVALSGSINTNYSNAARRDIPLGIVDVATGDYINVNGSKVPVMTQRRNFDIQKIPYTDQFKNNYSTSLYLSVRVPILNGFRARNRVSLAKIDLANATVVEQAMRTQLNQQVEQAFFQLNAARERYKTLHRQVEDFSESFRIAEVRFNAGVLTQVDYLIAKNNVDRSKINLISAKYDCIFRSQILDYYRGKLVL